MRGIFTQGFQLFGWHNLKVPQPFLRLFKCFPALRGVITLLKPALYAIIFLFLFFFKPICCSAPVDAFLLLQTEMLSGFAVLLGLFWACRKILIQSSEKETVMRLPFRGLGKPVHFYAGNCREQIHNSVQEQMNSRRCIGWVLCNLIRNVVLIVGADAALVGINIKSR